MEVERAAGLAGLTESATEREKAQSNMYWASKSDLSVSRQLEATIN